MSSGCGDVVSLESMQIARKHQIFEIEVITGKSGGVAGGADIDYAANPVTGQTQKTLPAVLRDVGFSPVSWDFSTGGTLTVNDRDKVVYDPVSKTWYSYAGALPVVVPASFNPVGNANWKPQTDPNLREDITSSAQDWASQIHIKTAYTGQVRKTIQQWMDERLTVLDFGALGDGSGRTPADDGISIMNEPWNTWDGTPFKDNLSYSPYAQSGAFVPTRTKPFADTDTWDFIGITRCLWQASVDVPWATIIPAGTYVINLDNDRHPLYKGLLLMKGMEQTIIGAGKYDTQIVPKEDANFFANSGAGANKFQLINLYRVGGPPTNISRLGLVGPYNYPQPMGNLSLIWGQNINGVTFEELWLSSCARGISLDTSSGDSHLKGSTFEFCFNETVYTDSSSELSIDFCNLWSSAQYNTQHGVYSAGRVSVTNCRFVNYHGYSIYANRGLFSNNYFQLEGTLSNAVVLGSGSIFNNNQLIGNSSDAMIRASSGTTISGCEITQGAPHSCIQLGSNDGNDASNITISGCTIIKNDAAEADYNLAIIAPKNGDWVGAASNSCLITGCTFQGRALTQVGKASHRNNVINGIIAAETYYGDIVAPTITTGTFSGSSYTGSVSGFFGQNDTSLRGRQRLFLLTVNSESTSHSVTAFCYFRTNHDGNVIIVQSIGSSGLNGGITFSASGGTPLFTINNSQATGGTFTANVIVMA